MNRFTDWLKALVDHCEAAYAETRRVPRYERIAFLVACNGGGFRVQGWGCIGYAGGPFRQGLDQNEAIELIGYAGFLDGAECVTPGIVEAEAVPLIDRWIKERQQAYKDATKAA